MQKHLVIRQATFISPLAFFALILCFCALPAGEKLEMEGEAYLELSHELPIDWEKTPAPAIQTSNKKGAHSVLASDILLPFYRQLVGLNSIDWVTKYPPL